MNKLKLLGKAAKVLAPVVMEVVTDKDSKSKEETPAPKVEESVKQGVSSALGKFSGALSGAVSKVNLPIPISDITNKTSLSAEEIAKRKTEAGKYMIGYGVDKDVLRAFEIYKQLAEAGDVDSMNIVGNMYYNCAEIFLEDNDNAFLWYSKAAKADHKEAMLNLANMYFKGEGTKKNVNEAVDWYSKAAEGGIAEAANILGNIYYKGDGIKQDRHEAFKWFRKSADAGNAEGMRNLGMMYFNEGGTNNYQQALKYFKKAAELNNADAMADIAFMYQNGYFVKKDTDKAYHWLQKSAEAGSANGMYNFGLLAVTHKRYSDALGWFIGAYDKSEGVTAGQIAYNISLIYRKFGNDKSDWLSSLTSSDNGDEDFRKADEWLNISKELKYKPPENVNQNSSGDDIITAIVGGVAFGAVTAIGLTVYGIFSFLTGDD